MQCQISEPDNRYLWEWTWTVSESSTTVYIWYGGKQLHSATVFVLAAGKKVKPAGDHTETGNLFLTLFSVWASVLVNEIFAPKFNPLFFQRDFTIYLAHLRIWNKKRARAALRWPAGSELHLWQENQIQWYSSMLQGKVSTSSITERISRVQKQELVRTLFHAQMSETFFR